MATNIGVGKSKSLDSKEAGREAVKNAIKNFGVNIPNVVFVYSTFGYNFQDLLNSIKEILPTTIVIGGSVFGVIERTELSDTNFHRVLVCAIYSDDFKMTPIMTTGLLEDAALAGNNLSKQIVDADIEDIKGVYLFMDGLKAADPDLLLLELEKGTNIHVPIFGGSAGEPLLWKNTYQFYDDKVLEDSVVGIVFSGKISISVASSHASHDLGSYHEVTKAEGSKLIEIDNKPAIDLFKELYGSENAKVSGLTATGVCLGTKVISREQKETLELRIPLSSNEDGSIVMAAAWPVGTRIYVCQRNIELIPIQNAAVLQSVLNKHNGHKPLLIFESDCMGRSPEQIGAEASKGEIQSIIDTVGNDSLIFGGYLYGELASIDNVAAFHNWTGSIACLYVE